MTTFTWSIVTLERNEADGGVVRAHFKIEAVDGEHTETLSGTRDFTPDASAEDFTAYNNLTEETVLGWVKDGIDTAGVEAQIQERLDAKKAPKPVVGMPWAA